MLTFCVVGFMDQVIFFYSLFFPTFSLSYVSCWVVYISFSIFVHISCLLICFIVFCFVVFWFYLVSCTDVGLVWGWIDSIGILGTKMRVQNTLGTKIAIFLMFKMPLTLNSKSYDFWSINYLKTHFKCGNEINTIGTLKTTI